MARLTQTFGKYNSAAYTDDGLVWRWVSNNAVCPLDACAEDGIPCDPEAQARAREIDVDKFLAEYRKNQPATPSAEEQCEMRAEFGPGAVVVNVITGRKWRT